MDRLSLNKNGFTFVEILIVLLIVSILSFGLYSKMHSSLYVFMRGYVLKKNNGFLLQDALFALFVILICSCLLAQGISTLYFQKDLKINEKIEKKWFHTD